MATSKYPPRKGSFIAWKKGRLDHNNGFSTRVLIKLQVPASAKRVLAERMVNYRGKIRVSEAMVLEIIEINQDGKPLSSRKLKKACNYYTSHGPFTYQVGKVVKPRRAFCTDLTRVCASGIHCFMRKSSALDL